jgi:hypothetical protein
VKRVSITDQDVAARFLEIMCIRGIVPFSCVEGFQERYGASEVSIISISTIKVDNETKYETLTSEDTLHLG